MAGEQASYIKARAGEKVVRIGFSNSCRGTADDNAILPLTGEKGVRFFKQSFELKIKGDLIPEAAVEPLIGELKALFARHGAGAALTAKAVFNPTKDFHTARHTHCSPEETWRSTKWSPSPPACKPSSGGEGRTMNEIKFTLRLADDTLHYLPS